MIASLRYSIFTLYTAVNVLSLSLKLGQEGVFLSDEVMDYILTRFSRDLGSLMEFLDQLDHYALQTKRAITVPLIKSMMENT